MPTRNPGRCLTPFWSITQVERPEQAEVRSYYLWVLIHRSATVPNVWRAEIPDLDYFAQARTPRGAIEAAQEVAEAIVINDLNANREPIQKGKARDARHEMKLAMNNAQPCVLDDILKRPESFDALIIRIAVIASRPSASTTTPSVRTVAERMPLMQPRRVAQG